MIDTYIHYINNVGGIVRVFCNLFKMFSRDMVQA